ncbi:MAG: hypothetical protein ABIH11_06860 [Candidatus Altiarchaeota archaeon]
MNTIHGQAGGFNGLPVIKFTTEMDRERHEQDLAETLTFAALKDIGFRSILEGIKGFSEPSRRWTEVVMINAREADKPHSRNCLTMHNVAKILDAGMRGGEETYAATLSCLADMAMDGPKMFGERVIRVGRKFDAMMEKRA